MTELGFGPFIPSQFSKTVQDSAGRRQETFLDGHSTRIICLQSLLPWQMCQGSHNLLTPLKKFFLMFISFLERQTDRQRQRTSGRGAEREGDTESKAGSRLLAVSTEPDTGLKPTNCEIVSWAEVRRLTNWGTQVPPLSSSIEWCSWEVMLMAGWLFRVCLFVF